MPTEIPTWEESAPETNSAPTWENSRPVTETANIPLWEESQPESVTPSLRAEIPAPDLHPSPPVKQDSMQGLAMEVSRLRARYDMAQELTDDPIKRQRLKDDFEKQMGRLGVKVVEDAPGIKQALLNPAIQFPGISREDMQVLFPYSKVAQVAGAAQRVISGAATGLTAPAAVATGVLPPAGQAIAAGAFGAQMASDVPELARKAGEASVNGDLAAQVEAAGNLIATSVFAAAAGAHALGAKPAEIAAPKPDALDSVTARAEAVAPMTAKALKDLTGQPEAKAPAAPEATQKGEIPNEAKTQEGQQKEGVLAPEAPPAFDETQPELIGMGGALAQGEPTKANVAQLGDSMRALAESSPKTDKAAEAFDMGSMWEDTKDAVASGLNGLKAAADYLKRKQEGKPVFDDIKAAVGDRHLALTDSVINNRKTAAVSEKAVPNPLDRAAISKWVDAGGDMEILKRGAAETVDRYKPAYEAAQNLSPELQTVARNVRNYFEARLQDAIDNGIIEGGVEDYIHRFYPGKSAWRDGVLAELKSQVSTARPALSKERVFNYDFEAEKAGLKPEQDFVKRVAAYDLALNKAIADKNLVKELSDINVASGDPMIRFSGKALPLGDDGKGATLIKPRAVSKEMNNDYVPYDHPALRKFKWAGTNESGEPIFYQGDAWVHKDAIDRVRALFERSKVRQNPVGRVMLNASSLVKQTMFDLSLFHPTQITVHGLEHRSIVPFNEGTAKALGVEFKPIEELINVPEVRSLVRGGMVIGETTGRELFHEGLAGSSLLRSVPKAAGALLEKAGAKTGAKVVAGIGDKLGAYTDWLFNDYIPRLKINTGLHALERNRKVYGDKLTEDELYHLTANQMNAAFGEQNYAMMGRNATTQDVLRLALVAPDFLEARAKFVGQAFTKYGREQLTALALGAGVLYFTARVLNKALDDEWHFEKRNMFSVIYKNRAYSLRTVQGDVLHMLAEPVKFLMHRLNPVFGRTLFEVGTGRDEFGRSRDAVQQLQDFASTIVPISLRGILNPSEQDIFESFLNSIGITERRASSVKLIYDLADDYKKANHIRQAPGEFIYDPDKDPYRGVKQAATFGSPDDVLSEVKKAIVKGTKKADMERHFRTLANAPFSGKQTEEPKFIKTLTADQKKIYDDAITERKQAFKAVEQALRRVR